VDVLILGELGTFLFNERLETFILARDKFLKPGGKMFPCQAQLCIAPLYDEHLYNFQLSKTSLWNNASFYGINLTSLKQQAIKEKLSQPIIDSYNPNTQ